MLNIYDFFKSGFNFLKESEIINAPLSELITLSESYKSSMQFWEDAVTYSLPAFLVTTPAFFIAIAVHPQERVTDLFRQRSPEELAEKRKWDMILATTGVLAGISGCFLQLSIYRFNKANHFYNRCVQRLTYEFSYKPGV